jgi:hypothetical protein
MSGQVLGHLDKINQKELEQTIVDDRPSESPRHVR